MKPLFKAHSNLMQPKFPCHTFLNLRPVFLPWLKSVLDLKAPPRTIAWPPELGYCRGCVPSHSVFKMPCAAGKRCRVQELTPAPQLSTNHKCCRCSGHLYGIYGATNPEFDSELKSLCEDCVGPHKNQQGATQKPQSSAGGSGSRLDGNQDRAGIRKGEYSKRKMLALSEKEHVLYLMTNKKLKTGEMTGHPSEVRRIKTGSDKTTAAVQANLASEKEKGRRGRLGGSRQLGRFLSKA